jgi:hypothetical protein
MLVVENYEATVCKDARVVITFDPPPNSNFRPSGDLVSALITPRGRLVMTWANGESALFPDCIGKMAAVVRGAPVICVRWLSDGDLVRGADLEMA